MNLIQSLRQNERWTAMASHALLILMLLFLAIGCVRFGEYIDQAWNSTGVLILSFLIILEAILSYRMVSPLSSHEIYRISEWVVIVIAVKVFTEMRAGMHAFLQNLFAWSKDFGLNFLTIDFVLNLALVIFIWVTTTLFARSLKDLEGDVQLYSDSGLPMDRHAAQGEILERILMLGLLLVVFAGVMRAGAFGLLLRPNVSIGAISFVFIYFLLGLVLLSLTQFASLRASWIAEKATIRQNLAAPWVFYSLIFLAGLTALAMSLPTRYALGFLDILAYILKFLGYVYQVISAIVIFLFASFIQIISRVVYPGEPPAKGPNPGLDLVNILPKAPDHLNLPSWWEFAKSVAFWALFVLILIYAISQYVQHNRSLAELLARLPVTKWLVRFWSWLRSAFRSAGRNVQSAIQSGIRQFSRRRGVPGPGAGWNLVNLRRLSPRQRVLFFYHALLRRADESGLPRQAWMTPGEYALSLGKQISDQQEHISMMTGAFVEARYTRHEVREDLAARVKSTWDRIRSHLRIRHG